MYSNYGKETKIEIPLENIKIVGDKFTQLLHKENKTTSANFNTIKAFANAIEAKDTYTRSHCDRVTKYSVLIGEKMQLSYEELVNLHYASILHDIGKIGIPDVILNKEGPLTNEEYAIIKKHPEIGYEIIKDVKFLRKIAEILLQHHERIDGNGYPRGLIGKEIDKLAKIISVADSFDAMTSERNYRGKPLLKNVAIKELIDNRGTQFDQQVVDIFVQIVVDKKIS